MDDYRESDASTTAAQPHLTGSKAATNECVMRVKFDWGAAVFKLGFIITQLVLGLPSFFYGVELVTRGKADGIINVIGLFLAWIGGTLAWGFASLMAQKSSFDLPAVYRVMIEQEVGEYRGFPYRKVPSGAVEVSTDQGLKTYPSFDEFRRIVD